MKTEYFEQLDENIIKQLPYTIIARRIYFTTVGERGTLIEKHIFTRGTQEIFTTSLIHLLDELRRGTVIEIRLFYSIDSFIRIYLDDNGKFIGEYFSKIRPFSQTTLGR